MRTRTPHALIPFLELFRVLFLLFQELYNVFVEESQNVKNIKLSYPSEKMYPISKPRGQVLYYIAGYTASRALTHQRRHTLSTDWERVVFSNTYRSSKEVVRTEITSA